MSIFQDEINNIAGETIFTSVELEKLFKSNSEREAFVKVRTALVESTNINAVTNQILGWGNDAVKILVKLCKYALTA